MLSHVVASNNVQLAQLTDSITNTDLIFFPDIEEPKDYIEFTLTDFLYSLFLIVIILTAAYIHQKRFVDKNPVYRYYFKGLFVKIIFSVIFILIFTRYYKGGDTVDYILSSISMSKLLFKNPDYFFATFFNFVDRHTSWLFFDFETGKPMAYMWKSWDTRFVISFSSIFSTIGLRAFVPTTILIASFSYLGVWKLYLFFVEYYPRLQKQMAIAILFVPSVLFWGSGVMKDTYTVAAAGWFVYNFYMIFFKKKDVLINVLIALFNVWVIVSVKPYVFVALFPGIIVWAMFERVKRIRNKVLSVISIPLMLSAGFVIIMFVFSALSDSLGTYSSFDEALKKAQTIQEDLLREEQYGSNNYNIGKIDGTLWGLLKVFPQAVIAGMYRPFIWEARNPLMLISGIENLILLLLTLYLLVKLKIKRFFSFIFSEPILLFSVMFSIFFFFAVGLASANFGALVRYKIPAMPFFIASVFIMLDKYKTYKKMQEEQYEAYRKKL